MMGKVIFIGGGNIAEAIFANLTKYPVVVVDHNHERQQYLNSTYPNLSVTAKLEFAPSHNDIVVLAVKPQNAKTTCQELAKYLNNPTILSVMAGIEVKTLKLWLTNNKIVRAMPNTPIMVGTGITGLFFSEQIAPATKQQTIAIFEPISSVHILTEENDINKIIATASSAPAYSFFFIEALIESAINNFGFDEITAKSIALEVIKGSLDLIKAKPDSSIATLRQNITSKGGATNAAIQTMIDHNFKQILSKAEIACYNRAIELGKNDK